MSKIRVNAICPKGFEVRWRAGHPWPKDGTVVEVSDFDPEEVNKKGELIADMDKDPEKDVVQGDVPTVINQRTLRALEADEKMLINDTAVAKDLENAQKQIRALEGEVEAIGRAAGQRIDGLEANNGKLEDELAAVKAERDECAEMVKSYNKELGEVKAELAALKATQPDETPEPEGDAGGSDKSTSAAKNRKKSGK